MAPSGRGPLSITWVNLPSLLCRVVLSLVLLLAFWSSGTFLGVLGQTDLLESFCSGRGLINSNLTCSCFTGFRGPDCSLSKSTASYNKRKLGACLRALHFVALHTLYACVFHSDSRKFTPCQPYLGSLRAV